MATIALGEILDDLQAAERGLHKFERRYWMSSAHFYELYSQRLLDDGSHAKDFSEWAGHYKIKQHREQLLHQLSEQRLTKLRAASTDGFIHLAPDEPVIEVAA